MPKHDPPLDEISLAHSGILNLIITSEGPRFWCTGCECFHGPVETCDVCGKIKPVHPGTNIMCAECYEARKERRSNVLVNRPMRCM